MPFKFIFIKIMELWVGLERVFNKMKMIDSPGNCLAGSILASILLDLGVRMAQMHCESLTFLYLEETFLLV